MKLTLIKFAVLALSVVTFASVASADTIIFNASTLGGDTFSATLTATPDATFVGAYDITGASGTVNGIAIDSAASAFAGPFSPAGTASPSGFFTYDNLFSPTGNPFDGNGLLVILTDGTEVNLYYTDVTPGSGVFYEYNQGTGLNYNSSITDVSSRVIPDTAPVPEPGTLLLCGTGVLGLAGMVRRRWSI